MLTLTDLTAYDSVRTVLGLSIRELEDGALTDSLFLSGLLTDVSDVGFTVSAVSDILADYQSLIDDSATPTTAAQMFVYAVNSFSAYSVAQQVLSGYHGMFPSYIADSKAAIKRNPEETISQVRAEFKRKYRVLQRAYANYLGVPVPAAPLPDLLSISSPTFDPVIGA